jgi:hypothetical protein
MVWAVSLLTTQLIPRRLTAGHFWTLRSLIGFGKRSAPEPTQRSTRPENLADAAPQCISGRTSYLRVRLAFHLYPQLF